MTRNEIEKWATAYIEAQSDPNLTNGQDEHPLWWAVEQFLDAGMHAESASPEDAWLTILEILRKQPPENVLGILAAGPLEDLIHDYGPKFIDLIEIESRQNPHFRHLLGGVWESSTPDIWNRIKKARGQSW